MIYKHKQPRVEAMQNDGTPEQVGKILSWINLDGGNAFQNQEEYYSQHFLILWKDELLFSVRPGNWVVKAAKGSFFVMIDEHFQAMYKGEFR